MRFMRMNRATEKVVEDFVMGAAGELAGVSTGKPSIAGAAGAITGKGANAAARSVGPKTKMQLMKSHRYTQTQRQVAMTRMKTSSRSKIVMEQYDIGERVKIDPSNELDLGIAGELPVIEKPGTPKIQVEGRTMKD